MQSKKKKSTALLLVLRENRGLAALYVAMGIACAFIESYGPIYLKRVLDGFQYGTLSAALLLGYGGILTVQCVLEYLDNDPVARLPNRIALGLKVLALKKMAVVDYRCQQGLGTGSLIQRIESGAESGKRILYDYYLRMARELFPSIAFSLLFIASIDKRIVLYVAAGYLVVFAISNLLIRRLYRIKERILDSEEHFQNILVRGLTELAVFRLNKRYAHEIRRAEEAAETITGARVKIRMIHEAFFASFFLLVI
nr:ABC transporter ATP-binding protein [Clostridia bacterium]